MCRLFGFRSILKSQVHQSLIQAENALALQSTQHPDGWGVGFFVAGAPHVIRSCEAAVEDRLFKKVSGLVSSYTVLAHIRKATQGEKSVLNTHPFQFGRWIFAHNGSLWGFSDYKEEIKKWISPRLRPFILGETDSECFFYLLLSNLEERAELEGSPKFDDLACATEKSIQQILKLSPNYHPEKTEPDREETSLSFILTNGEVMVAYHGGQSLFYSTHKSRCSERRTCSFFTPNCEQAVSNGRVNHLILASSPPAGENIWQSLEPSQLVGVDQGLNFQKRLLSF